MILLMNKPLTECILFQVLDRALLTLSQIEDLYCHCKSRVFELWFLRTGIN